MQKSGGVQRAWEVLDSEEGKCLACSQNSKKATVATEETMKGEW